MAKNLKWKILVILAVIALAVFAFYPPDQKVKLGLDLKGGVQLVLRVVTDDALRLEVQTSADRLAEQLKTANIPVTNINVNSPTSFSVTIPPEQDAAFRASPSMVELEANYERSSSGGTHTFSLRPNIVVNLREDTVNQALQTIERRVNELGVAEPVIARHSAADQILVMLPGVTDVDRAKESRGLSRMRTRPGRPTRTTFHQTFRFFRARLRACRARRRALAITRSAAFPQ
jgi:preprotein translocase subunit SecD